MLNRVAKSVVGVLWVLGACLGVLGPAGHAAGDVAYSQPPSASGGQYKSAWYPPDGLDGDEYVWDGFTLASNTAITEVRWRGAYTNYLSGAGKAPVSDFTVSIYASIGGGSQPDVISPPLVSYQTNGNAGETPAGSAGGVLMYDYAFILPSPFQAVAGTKYWVQIVASQGTTPTYGWPPDWSIAAGTGGDGSHFRKVTGGNYGAPLGDCAFTLMKSAAAAYTITASVDPVNSGTILGAGSYPTNSTATLTASANAGYGFVTWTENGSQVSTNPNYAFTVTRDRTLVANFVPAYTVTTESFPLFGGTTSGGGIYNSGSAVHVVAAPRQGYVFESWTDWGAVVSTTASYTFSSDADHALVANFVPGPLTVTFDLDSGDPPPMARMTATPFDNGKGGVTAHFSSPQDGGIYAPAFSLQSDATVGWSHQVHLGGNYLWPDSVYRNDLRVSFSRPLTSVSLDFATVEMEAWADTPSPLILTAYMDSTANPPVGTAQASALYGRGTTYPEGLLVFTSAAPFNLITLTVGTNRFGTVDFMADNFTVEMVCTPVSVTDQPFSVATCPSGGAAFTVAANGAGTFAYQWQRETTPGIFVNLSDGPTTTWDGGTPGVGAMVYGANTNILSIFADSGAGNRLSSAHAVRYRCSVTNACGAATSDPAQLTVCHADYNCDGFMDGLDYDLFNADFENYDPAQQIRADYNGDGFVDGIDYDMFNNDFAVGC